MPESRVQITVLFENPFWIGVYERESEGKFQVCKITFGKEPKDYEVYDFFLRNWGKLTFTRAAHETKTANVKINPKRMQRYIQKSLQKKEIGTKAQHALNRQREENKIEKRSIRKEQKELLAKEKLEKHRAKKKEKHKGR